MTHSLMQEKFCCILLLLSLTAGAQAQTVQHGKQRFRPSATEAGIELICAALPSSPDNGDFACDSGDSNKTKTYSNGAWVTIGSGGGSTGAAMAATDYTPTRTSDTVLTLPAIAAGFGRIGEVLTAAVASSTFTVSSGTGTLWVALGSDGEIKVRHNIVGSCSATCTAVASATGFEPTDLPLYQWGVTTAVLAANGTLKLTPYVSRPLVAGTNVSFGHTAGVTTINASGGAAPYYQYFSAATANGATNQDSYGGSSTNAGFAHTNNGGYRVAWLELLNTADTQVTFTTHLPFTPTAVKIRFELGNKNNCTSNCVVRVDAAIGCAASGDATIFAYSFNSATSATRTLSTTNNTWHVWEVSPDFTGCTVGKIMKFYINRDQDHADDTFSDGSGSSVAFFGAFLEATP